MPKFYVTTEETVLYRYIVEAETEEEAAGKIGETGSGMGKFLDCIDTKIVDVEALNLPEDDQ